MDSYGSGNEGDSGISVGTSWVGGGSGAGSSKVGGGGG